MKFTVSKARRISSKTGNVLLQFSLTLESGVFCETHDRCLVGKDLEGNYWVQPPSPNRNYCTTTWNKAIKDKILLGLQEYGLLKDIGSQWQAVSTQVEEFSF